MTRKAILTLALAGAACSGRGEGDGQPQPDTICTLEARSAFAVTVLDDATGRNLAPAANVRVTDGTQAEALTPMGGTYSGAYERAGTFTVIVSHPEYQQWQRAGVVVERDECHVITEPVEARLTRR